MLRPLLLPINKLESSYISISYIPLLDNPSSTSLALELSFRDIEYGSLQNNSDVIIRNKDIFMVQSLQLFLQKHLLIQFYQLRQIEILRFQSLHNEDTQTV